MLITALWSLRGEGVRFGLCETDSVSSAFCFLGFVSFEITRDSYFSANGLIGDILPASFML